MARSVGVVADTATGMVQLRKLVNELEHRVTYALTAEQALQSSPLYPELWVVVSELAPDVFEILTEWSDVPIFLADDLPCENNQVHFQQWRESLGEKIIQTLNDTPEPEKADRPTTDFKKQAQEKEELEQQKLEYAFEEIWVLAASLGGPEAVRVFLEHINPELPIAMVYAQHIEQNFDKMLPIVLGKNSQFELDFCSSGEQLKKGRVVVFPSHMVAKVEANDHLAVFEDQEWEKPYTPNIDQVISNVGEFYRERMGIIIFSGMCDDGAASSIALAEHGVPLWAQIPVECICSAMPEAVIESGKVSVTATAEALAKRLNARYGFEEEELEPEELDIDLDDLDDLDEEQGLGDDLLDADIDIDDLGDTGAFQASSDDLDDLDLDLDDLDDIAELDGSDDVGEIDDLGDLGDLDNLDLSNGEGQPFDEADFLFDTEIDELPDQIPLDEGDVNKGDNP